MRILVKEKKDTLHKILVKIYRVQLRGLPSKAPGSARSYSEAILPWLSQHRQLELSRTPSPSSKRKCKVSTQSPFVII